MGKRTQTLDRETLPRRPASPSRLFTVDVETGVVRVLGSIAAVLWRCVVANATPKLFRIHLDVACS